MTLTTANTAPTFVVSVGSSTFGTASSLLGGLYVGLDGTILVGGSLSNPTSHPAVLRINADGTLDTSFGSNGIALASGPTFTGTGFVVSPDGKLILGGSSSTSFGLFEFGATGSPNTAFGTGGLVATPPPAGSNFYYGESLSLQADGKIIVVGRQDFAMAVGRYNADGTVDTSYGTNGFTKTSISSWDIPIASAIDASGRLVITGVTTVNGGDGGDVFLERFDSSGHLDNTFGLAGVVRLTPAGQQYAHEIVFDQSGRILVSGMDNGGTTVWRFQQDGTLDTAFGIAGSVHIQNTISSPFKAGLAIQQDGRILVGEGQIVARLTSNGALDSSFGVGGIVDVHHQVGAVSLAPAGKIVVAGDGTGFIVDRLNSDGSPDTSFSSPVNTLPATATATYFEHSSPVLLATGVHIRDAELSAAGSYAGSTLTLQRHLGASADDAFSAHAGSDLGPLLEGQYFSVGGTTVGFVTRNSGGVLTLTFNASATQLLVDEALSQIAYQNTSSAPPAILSLDWTFSDGNDGSQGTGGALSTTQTMQVNIFQTNDAPNVANPIPFLLDYPGAWSYQIPANTFADPDSPALTYSATMENGSALPPWLTFDPSTRTLTASAGAVAGDYRVSVTASDGSLTASDVFSFTVASRISGTAGADHLTGTTGADFLAGLGGADVLNGGNYNDWIDGGAGNDIAVYSVTHDKTAVIHFAPNHTLVVNVSLNASDEGVDTLQRIEQIRFADGLFSYVFTKPGTTVLPNFNPAYGWASQDQYPRHVADVNGDGYADIVGFGTAGVLVSFGGADGNFTGAAVKLADFGQNAGWATDNGFHREIADVNGDGRADIIGFGFAGTLVSLAKADGTFASVKTGITDFGVNQGWANQNGFARTVADVNGDGKADIVGFGYAGALVALGNGDGTFQSVRTAIANFGVNQGWTNDNSFHRAVADVNGDGKADIIGFGIAGTYVALSNGDGTFADAKLVLNDFGANQGWSSNDSFSRLVADVNGDHLADIVGFGIAGTLVAFGNGDGTFTQAGSDVSDFGKGQGWSSDNTFHREIADMNHDGLADIVGFGIAGVLVGQNQGDFLI